MAYELMTLDAKVLLERYCSVEQDKDTKNWKAVCACDLSDRKISREAILSTESQGDNAFFYQIEQCLKAGDRLEDTVVFLDFGRVFFGIETKENYSKEELEQDEKARVRYMFPRKKEDGGIWLTFADGKKRRFVPFDKSSNMSRDSRISFIDEDIKDKMEPRLTLDITFPQCNLSKYYAYRGLYLSDGIRVEQKGTSDGSFHGLSDEFLLNEETVLVLCDTSVSSSEQSIFTAIRNKNGDDWTFQELEKKMKIDEPFDGEGLISPDYAAAINAQLKNKHHFKEDSYSFQIRMPFAKGMLHTVDYCAFFRDEMGLGGEALYLADAFGIVRDIRKAHIILTTSMFKCYKWLKKMFAGKSDSGNHGSVTAVGSSDPMQYYFKKFNEYQHALYVLLTDVRLSNHGKIPMNHQFLSTLGLSHGDFKKIVDEHIEMTKNIPCSFVGPLSSDEVNEQTSDPKNEGERAVSSYDDLTNVRAKVRRAVQRNKVFLRDPQARQMIQFDQWIYEKCIGLGKLETSGEQRFLSRDLLKLLIDLSSKIMKDDTNHFVSRQRTELEENFEKLKDSLLKSDDFYMACGQEQRLATEAYYGILRNPHLSRNEQCILRPSYGELHEKYFSALRGIIMVSDGSLVPFALSGADFDGDIVKVIKERAISNAIAENVYQQAQDGEYVRKMSIIDIPKPSTQDETIPASIPFSLVRNTFSNQIGHISNLAVTIAKKEYFEVPDDEKYKDGCAKCTIATGLEIDAAKTGVRPTKIIKTLEGIANTDGDSFIKNKDKIKSMDSRFSPIVIRVSEEKASAANGTDGQAKERQNNKELNGAKPAKSRSPKIDSEKTVLFLYRTKQEADKKNPCMEVRELPEPEPATPERRGGATANLDYLPQYFLSYLFEKKTGENNKAKAEPETENDNPKARRIYFKFQVIKSKSDKDKMKSWKSGLDERKMDDVRALVYAYNKVLRLHRETAKIRHDSANMLYCGYVKKLLSIQYDNPYNHLVVDEEKEEIRQVLNETYVELFHFLHNARDAENAIQRLIDKKWQYCPKDDRKKMIAYILTGKEKENDMELSKFNIALLSNFSNHGYSLLYYMLKDVRARYKENLDAVDYFNETYSKQTPSNSKEDMEKNSSHFFNTLFGIYVDATSKNAAQKVWNRKLIKKCREFLKKLFLRKAEEKDAMDEALKYVFAVPLRVDVSRRFLWNVFSIDELLRNIEPEGDLNVE